MRTMLLTICALLIVALPAQAQDGTAEVHPLMKDKTGISWTLPFKKAKARADADTRLLMIKPVAFGTDRQGGW